MHDIKVCHHTTQNFQQSSIPVVRHYDADHVLQQIHAHIQSWCASTGCPRNQLYAFGQTAEPGVIRCMPEKLFTRDFHSVDECCKPSGLKARQAETLGNGTHSCTFQFDIVCQRVRVQIALVALYVFLELLVSRNVKVPFCIAISLQETAAQRYKRQVDRWCCAAKNVK